VNALHEEVGSLEAEDIAASTGEQDRRGDRAQRK
jgi:hypothetical protein